MHTGMRAQMHASTQACEDIDARAHTLHTHARQYTHHAHACDNIDARTHTLHPHARQHTQHTHASNAQGERERERQPDRHTGARARTHTHTHTVCVCLHARTHASTSSQAPTGASPQSEHTRFACACVVSASASGGGGGSLITDQNKPTVSLQTGWSVSGATSKRGAGGGVAWGGGRRSSSRGTGCIHNRYSCSGFFSHGARIPITDIQHWNPSTSGESPAIPDSGSRCPIPWCGQRGFWAHLSSDPASPAIHNSMII